MAKKGYVVRTYSGRRMVRDRWVPTHERAVAEWFAWKGKLMITGAKIFEMPGFKEIAAWEDVPASYVPRPGSRREHRSPLYRRKRDRT